MIASRMTAPREGATIARHLQLTGLLLAVIAAREIHIAGVLPLTLFALLVGVAMLAGATFLRRRRREIQLITPIPVGREIKKRFRLAPTQRGQQGMRVQ